MLGQGSTGEVFSCTLDGQAAAIKLPGLDMGTSSSEKLPFLNACGNLAYLLQVLQQLEATPGEPTLSVRM